jgi:hypothetical protein
MNFAGNGYTYISKKKLENIKKRKYKTENVDFMDIEEEEKEHEDINKPMRRDSTKKQRSRSRSRSRSIERNNEEELDEVYSCDEDEVKLEKKAGGPKSVKYKIATAKTEKKVYEHEIDTNILTIKFDFLKDKVGYATGDPFYCKECQAVLNKYSKLEPIPDSYKSIWVCEFCNVSNEITIEKEEFPTSDCIDYFVQSYSQINNNLKDFNYNDEQSLIFCFDISGSMCVSTPIEGKHKFKGCYLDKTVKDLMAFSDRSDQFIGNRNVTYISRLQCLQAAIENNLNNIVKAAPSRKLGYVVFNNEVTCFGDCTKQPYTLNGNNLNDYNAIIKLAEANQNLITSPIKDTYDTLIKQLYQIEENGQTALGPAVLFSINLIKGVSPGSKIILCTDGISNIGLGAIEGVKSEEEIEKLRSFYTQLGIIAKEKGIVINLITFEEAESKIEIVMAMIEQTGGEIIRVKPSEILNEFSNLLSNEVIATNVKVKVKLHKTLQFRNENTAFLKYDGSTLEREVGNATNQTELYVEYNMKKSEDIAKYEDINIETLTSVPFQSVIDYTNKSGDRCYRVITATQKISSEKDEIQKNANYDIISTNAIKKTSELAEEGRYREAQSQALAWKKMLKKTTEQSQNAYANYELFSNNMNSFNNNIQALQYNQLKEESLPTKYNKNDNISQQIHSMKHISQAKSKNIYEKNKKK